MTCLSVQLLCFTLKKLIHANYLWWWTYHARHQQPNANRELYDGCHMWSWIRSLFRSNWFHIWLLRTFTEFSVLHCLQSFRFICPRIGIFLLFSSKLCFLKIEQSKSSSGINIIIMNHRRLCCKHIDKIHLIMFIQIRRDEHTCTYTINIKTRTHEYKYLLTNVC